MSASREKRLRREIREAENNSDIVKKVKKKKCSHGFMTRTDGRVGLQADL